MPGSLAVGPFYLADPQEGHFYIVDYILKIFLPQKNYTQDRINIYVNKLRKSEKVVGRFMHRVSKKLQVCCNVE